MIANCGDRPIRFLYSALFYLCLPLILLRLLWRALGEPAYARRWNERFARIAPTGAAAEPVWVHAVSAGETVAIVPLIRALAERDPSLTFFVTTMTPTGSERVSALLGDRVRHAYVPYDLPHVVRRFLDRIRPRMLILTDTELWPNILHQCRGRGIPVIQANARLSVRSASRYAHIPGIMRDMLAALDHVAAQSKSQGERFVALGLPRERLTTTGSIKFDLALPADLSARRAVLLNKIGAGRTVFVAASTHAGEEELLLDACGETWQACPDMLLVLVPRHPPRFDEVARLLEERDIAFVRHSKGDPCSNGTSVLLGDTMGDLLHFYGVADLAFIGGSLVPVGGHNLMEAAAFGLPMLMGPHRFNIEDISRTFIDAGALAEVSGREELAALTTQLCRDGELRQRMGQAGARVMEDNRGALAATLEIVERLLRRGGATRAAGRAAPG